MNRFYQIRLVLAAVLLFLSAACIACESCTAKVIGISDGNTIKVLHDGQQVRIRLYGIDTPEKRQAFENKAKQYTADKVFKKTVLVIPIIRALQNLQRLI